jgi:drug/metabolite transporter (DMT)-like permease
LGNLLSGVIGLPLILGGGQTINATEIGIILFLGVFQLGLPFIIITLAVKQLSALETILIETLEPLLNPVWVFLVIGEVPAPTAVLGAAVIIVSVTVNTVLTTRKSPAEKAHAA